MRKIFTFILSAVVFFTAIAPAISISAANADTTGKTSLNIKGSKINYQYKYTDDKTIVTFMEKNKLNTIVYDRINSKMHLNDKEIPLNESSVASVNKVQSRKWVLAGKSNGVLSTNVTTAAAAAGLIIALVGGPATWAAAINLGAVIVNKKLKKVYYTKFTYYDDKTINQQRPRMKIVHKFYSDSKRKKLIGQIG